jgi:hypothetical protein
MSRDLTWWIEDAEARRFCQTAALDCRRVVPPRRHDVLGETMAKVPVWLHALTHVGCASSRNKR